MTRLLSLSLLALVLAGPASAQTTFDTVDDFIARAATTPSLQAGADVKIRRAIVAGAPRTGGELPERWVFADYPGTGPKSWRDPFVQFDLRSTGPASLRVHLVTQQWQNSYDYDGTLDDILVVDTEHQQVQRGYTLELRGRVVYDRVNERYTLFPRVRRSSADEGLRVTGSVGAPVVPELREVHYADDVVSAGATVRLRGYGLGAGTKVRAGGVQLPVVSVSANGKELVASVPADAPHGVVALACEDAQGRAGLGAPRLGINRAPQLSSLTGVRFVAGREVELRGLRLSNVSSMAELAPSTFGLGLQAPDVQLGDRRLRARLSGDRLVVTLPADLVLGQHELVVSNDAGAARATVRVIAGTTGIVATIGSNP
jgi:hypothetical protein